MANEERMHSRERGARIRQASSKKLLGTISHMRRRVPPRSLPILCSDHPSAL